MKIVFISSEVFPYAKTGGLADVCGALPLALEKLGMKVSIFLPRYKMIDLKKYQVQKINEHLYKTTLGKAIDVYFIENAALYNRDGIYGDKAGDFADNLDRFQYFCIQVFKTLKDLKQEVDILHCHDWQTALIPVYLREIYGKDPFFAKTKSIFTIHNMAYQGIFPKDEYGKIGLGQELFGMDGFEFYGKINLLKAGIIFSDEVTTVSPQYAKEIQTSQFGCGLDSTLKSYKEGVRGILNGIDYVIWDPQTDTFLEKQYSPSTYEQGKRLNKAHLQQIAGLALKPNAPLYGFVGRLSYQKGVDLITSSFLDLMEMDIQCVFQGVGETIYTTELQKLANQFPNKFAFINTFDEKTAHEIYAGADLFLMPSRYEPCGLSQMISLRYGTIPVVFKTGGLADTVVHFSKSDEKGNGFVFDKFDKNAFVEAIDKSQQAYHQKTIMNRLINNGFACDFSWEHSAHDYVGMYQEIAARKDKGHDHRTHGRTSHR